MTMKPTSSSSASPIFRRRKHPNTTLQIQRRQKNRLIPGRFHGAISGRFLSHEGNSLKDQGPVKTQFHPVTDPPPTEAESSLTRFLKSTQEVLEASSGLTEIAHLKRAVQEASEEFDRATKQVADCRMQVVQAQRAHDVAHKRHVSLLMRREEWSAEDAATFVSMTGEEVGTRQALLEAQELLRRSEDAAIRCQHAYMDVMRRRYHEEQLWQDKWRLLGTYGTWSLIGINTLVFLMGQYRAEQREIRRLNHMEELLIKNTQWLSAGVPAVVAEDDSAAGTVDDQYSESPTDCQSPETLEASPSEEDENLLGFPIDTRSLAIGAAAGASCFILFSLLVGR